MLTASAVAERYRWTKLRWYKRREDCSFEYFVSIPRYTLLLGFPLICATIFILRWYWTTGLDIRLHWESLGKHWSNRSPRLDPHSLNLGIAEQPFKFQHVAEPQNTPNINGNSTRESSNTSNLDNTAQIQKLKERRLFQHQHDAT